MIAVVVAVVGPAALRLVLTLIRPPLEHLLDFVASKPPWTRQANLCDPIRRVAPPRGDGGDHGDLD